jgi:phosphatidylglycerophosphate synthase
MALLGAPLLTPEGLARIQAKEYVPCTTTRLDDSLQPLWNCLVHFLPTWLAPNCITVLGFLPLALAYFHLCAACPTLTEPVPPWLLGAFGAASIFYFVADNLDGKQARRTESASPLGQLFDHGVDALAVVPYHAFIAVGVLRAGGTRVYVATQVLVQTVFFLGQWQERYTSVCPNAGTAEICLLVSTLVLTAGALGPDAMQSLRMLHVFGGVDVQSLIVGALICSAVLATAFLTASTLRASMQQQNSRRALEELAPIFFMNLGALLWSDDAVKELSVPISLCTGLVLYFCTAQMIVFSMARQLYPCQQPAVALYMASAWLSRHLSPSHFRYWLACSSLCIFYVSAAWLSRVVLQLTRQLGVHLFRLPPKGVSLR